MSEPENPLELPIPDRGGSALASAASGVCLDAVRMFVRAHSVEDDTPSGRMEDRVRPRCTAAAAERGVAGEFWEDAENVPVRTMKVSPKRAKIAGRAGPIWHYVALRGTRVPPTL